MKGKGRGQRQEMVQQLSDGGGSRAVEAGVRQAGHEALGMDVSHQGRRRPGGSCGLRS